MNTVEAAKAISTIIQASLAEISFRPPAAKYRAPRVPMFENPPKVSPVQRDDASSWTIFIEYVDSGGYESERRITVLRFENRVGGAPAIAALCHECGDHRLFRLDRIQSVMDLQTGEVHDATVYMETLRREGLPSVNRGMHSFCRVLAFIARCDGSFHSSEHEAIETALTSYAIRFGGETDDIAVTMTAIKNMTPDTRDLNNALIALLRSPREVRGSVAALLRRCIGDVIDADGVHALEEVEWAMALCACLAIIDP